MPAQTQNTGQTLIPDEFVLQESADPAICAFGMRVARARDGGLMRPLLPRTFNPEGQIVLPAIAFDNRAVLDTQAQGAVAVEGNLGPVDNQDFHLC